jgi:hypothetical protein
MVLIELDNGLRPLARCGRFADAFWAFYGNCSEVRDQLVEFLIDTTSGARSRVCQGSMCIRRTIVVLSAVLLLY